MRNGLHQCAMIAPPNCERPIMALPKGDLQPRVEDPLPSGGDRGGMLVLVVLVPVIVVADFLTRREIPMQTLYLFATGLAAWSFGLRAGLAVGLVAALFAAFVGYAARAGAAGIAPVLWEAALGIMLYSAVAWLLARHRAFGDEARAAARIDAESGALSRREFLRLLDGEARRAWRYRRAVAVLLVDVGEAKEAAAKPRQFLPTVARLIREAMRESDAVGRVDALRFAVVLVECPAAEAYLVAERMRAALLANLRVKSGAVAVGMANFEGGEPTTATDLMAQAHSHLVRARGGDAVVAAAGG
jgi:diguanylate cyclase (GGDEF)-like protein